MTITRLKEVARQMNTNQATRSFRRVRMQEHIGIQRRDSEKSGDGFCLNEGGHLRMHVGK